MTLSRAGLFFAAAPALIMLVLYYSLAIHMHRALGGWPASIGERGLPFAVVVHARIETYFLIALILSFTFALPLAAVVCGVVLRWRRFLPYLGVFGVSCLATAGLMQLAPAAFLDWWWD